MSKKKEPNFLGSVQQYFDKAAPHTGLHQGLLEQIPIIQIL